MNRNIAARCIVVVLFIILFALFIRADLRRMTRLGLTLRPRGISRFSLFHVKTRSAQMTEFQVL